MLLHIPATSRTSSFLDGDMANRLPEDLVSLFAVAARDVLWFKDKLMRVFRRAGVPEALVLQLERQKKEPTIKLCQQLLDDLERRGDEGERVIQTLFTTVADWQDLTHLEPDKQRVARRRQADLKNANRSWADREQYRQQKEKEAQREREARVKVSAVDHGRLASFRDRFDAIFALTDRKARGDAFEVLLNDIFSYYCQKSLGAFLREGEQIDGQFYFDGHYYFVEVRWREQKANAADVSVLRDRAHAGFGGDVRALFVSFNGFTQDCIEALAARGGNERVILMTGDDLRVVLNGDIAFDVLLDEKLARAVRDNKPLATAREIILARIESTV
jgi:hypothetical protein